MRTRPIRRHVRRESFRPAAVLALVAIWPLACGPKVEAVETAQVVERDDDAEVLVYVRDVDGIPACPWEVLGTVEIDDDWTEEDELRGVKRAAARLGGHAVMAESATSEHVRVLRFFDPLCNPLQDRD